MDRIDEVLEELRALRKEVAELKARAAAPGARYVPVDVAAVRLGCSADKVFRLLAEASLKRGARVGKRTTVTLASLEAYEASLAPAPAPSPARPERPAALPQAFDAEADSRALEQFGDDFKTAAGTKRGRK